MHINYGAFLCGPEYVKRDSMIARDKCEAEGAMSEERKVSNENRIIANLPGTVGTLQV